MNSIEETRCPLKRSALLHAVLLFLFFMIIPFHQEALAQSIVVGKDKAFEPRRLMLPYAFYNENFGAAVGVVYGGTGILQKQATFVATAIAGSNDAAALFLLARDYQAPFVERLFIDTDVALSTYGTIKSYQPGNPYFRNERAGSNSSDSSNYIAGQGNDNFGRVKFRYLLPMGHGRDQVINTLVLDNWTPVEGMTGGESLWNPLQSGRTFLEAKPYWREQIIHSEEIGKVDRKTNGAEFSLLWENTDWARNPTRGNSLRLRYNQDWGLFDSTTPYKVLDAEFSQYYSLGPSETFRQRTFAFDLWTSNSPSWDSYNTRNNGQQVFERAPAFSGSTLGGIFRMRAYPTSRFNDQAAIYYSLEYRLMPNWNPWAKIDWVRKYLGIDFWQIVPFVEVARVAPQWSPDVLHSSMKWDAGVGFRAIAKGLMIRIDAAGGKEGYGVAMMVGHPFNF